MLLRAFSTENRDRQIALNHQARLFLFLCFAGTALAAGLGGFAATCFVAALESAFAVVP